MVSDISITDYLEIRSLIFEWAESYDQKDWDHLKELLAPSIRVDYTPLGGEVQEGATPDEFAAAVQKLIADPLIKTQHFLGASRWKTLDDGSVELTHQARVAHQRYAAEDLAEVKNHGHGHGTIQHTVKKIDGTWKINGYKPKIDWTEYDLFGTLNPGGA